MSDITVTARICRFDPQDGASPRYESYEVSGPPTMRVLEVLRSVYENQAGDLAFQYACRIGRCGTCSVIVNGRPVLACQERAKPEMTIEPLSPFPVLRDLVIDRSEAEQRYAALDLAPKRAAPHGGEPEEIDPEEAREVGLLATCACCMVCVSACPAVAERAFDGPAFMLQLRRLADLPADTGDRLAQALDGGMAECFGCDICTQLCPADLSPADAIRDFRRDLLWRWLGRKNAAGNGAAP